ncbi:hypothetical protein O181_048056 [Austropuccinia psidii MF-1]|uniref:Uncharacterized protein n=1 Tax=Austropuccinia psidii MF-1 TaxID=1389203 RepID=A0A9Q3DX98_9BASI|nr:hypothetical protein [Austropuccinia psidii MF-1]
MTPTLLGDILFPRNNPEHWSRRYRARRQPITGPNDHQRTYQQGTAAKGLIPDKPQPRSPTRGLERCISGHTNSQTPERPLYMEHGLQAF